MLSQTYHLIRSKTDGQYLVARPRQPSTEQAGYLLLFRERFEALSYLNTHATEKAGAFIVETTASNQLGSLMQRWGFTGIGVVKDPLVPQIEFFSQD